MKFFEHKVVHLFEEVAKISESYADVEENYAAMYEDTLDKFGTKGGNWPLLLHAPKRVSLKTWW